MRGPDSNIVKRNRGSKRVDEEGLKAEMTLSSLGSPFDLFDIQPEDLPPICGSFKKSVLEPLIEMGLITVVDTLVLKELFASLVRLEQYNEALQMTQRDIFSEEFEKANKYHNREMKIYGALLGKLGFTPKDRANLIAKAGFVQAGAGHGNSDRFNKFDTR